MEMSAARSTSFAPTRFDNGCRLRSQLHFSIESIVLHLNFYDALFLSSGPLMAEMKRRQIPLKRLMPFFWQFHWLT